MDEYFGRWHCISSIQLELKLSFEFQFKLTWKFKITRKVKVCKLSV